MHPVAKCRFSNIIYYPLRLGAVHISLKLAMRITYKICEEYTNKEALDIFALSTQGSLKSRNSQKTSYMPL